MRKKRCNEIRLLANFPKKQAFLGRQLPQVGMFCMQILARHSNCDEPIKQMNWMTKRIKKVDKTHIVAFCSTHICC
jgi:hypothetical protein